VNYRRCHHMLKHYWPMILWKWTSIIRCAPVVKGMFYNIATLCSTLTSLFSNKNSMPVTESISIFGKPQSVWLDDQEKALLLSMNIHTNGPVLLYPQISLHKTNRVIIRESRKTLRNDSCFRYKANGSVNVVILHKVILHNENCFIFLNRLSTFEERLCNEQISYLNVDDHIYKCSFRYNFMYARIIRKCYFF